MALVASSIVCPGRDARSLSFHPVSNCPFNFLQPSKVDRIAELGFGSQAFRLVRHDCTIQLSYPGLSAINISECSSPNSPLRGFLLSFEKRFEFDQQS